MLDLLICEFSKIKRQKFIRFSLMAAFLFPIPLTILMAKDRMSFDQLFRANVMFGELLLLPCILGIIASILFFMERDNDTLKNLVTVPVSRTKIVLAKLFVITILSVLYSVAALGATVIGGLIIGGVEGVLLRLGISIVLGIGLCNYLAVLPVITFFCRKQNGFFAGVGFAFVYGFCGIFVAGRSLTDFYPITAGLGIFGYTGQGTVVYNSAIGYSVLFVMLIASVVFVRRMPNYDEITTVSKKQNGKHGNSKRK